MEGPEIKFAEAVIDNGTYGKRVVRFETGRLAQQAQGAVAAYLDEETMILSLLAPLLAAINLLGRRVICTSFPRRKESLCANIFRDSAKSTTIFLMFILPLSSAHFIRMCATARCGRSWQ